MICRVFVAWDDPWSLLPSSPGLQPSPSTASCPAEGIAPGRLGQILQTLSTLRTSSLLNGIRMFQKCLHKNHFYQQCLRIPSCCPKAHPSRRSLWECLPWCTCLTAIKCQFRVASALLLPTRTLQIILDVDVQIQMRFVAVATEGSSYKVNAKVARFNLHNEHEEHHG